MGALLSCLRADADVEERYVPVKRVGSGAEADVWLARERCSGSLFALKLVKRGMAAWQAEAFAREVQCSLLFGATHVNVVRPHELLLTRRHAVLVTSYEAGGTLAAYCARHSVDEATACYFFRQLVAALAHCRAQAIAFRDVKLDNVLLDASQPPALRLCDFGVARCWAAAPGSAGHEHFSTLAGTPGYLSPQVLDALHAARRRGIRRRCRRRVERRLRAGRHAAAPPAVFVRRGCRRAGRALRAAHRLGNRAPHAMARRRRQACSRAVAAGAGLAGQNAGAG